MAYARLLTVMTALLLGTSACSTGHYSASIPGSYGTSFTNGLAAARAGDLEQAAENYAFAARSGHPKAEITYGDVFYYGRGVERDPARALELYESAYSKSSKFKSRAAYALGQLLLNGGEGPSGSVAPDQERGLQLLIEGYNDGQTKAAAGLAKAYDEGLGTTRDVDAAINFYSEAASTSVNAALRLADLLVEVGAPKVRVTAAANKAVAQLEQRAEKGNERSWIALADIFTSNEIMDPDPARALSYLENVDADDNPAVLRRLAKIHGELGDETERLATLRKAADLGDQNAQTRLAGLFLRAGTPNTNGSVGRYYAERAIAQGSELAMIYLGRALLKGDVLEPDLEIGEVLLRRVNDAGNVRGKAELGVALLREQIPERFPGERLALLEEAADEGSTFAMSALGFAYYHGRGLQQDESAALRWLQRAADAGHDRSKQFLREQVGA